MRKGICCLLAVLMMVGGWCVALERHMIADKTWWTRVERPAIRMSDLDAVGMKKNRHSAYTTIRFGGGSNDVLYLVFECSDKLTPHDEMYVLVPGHSKYGKVVRRSGKDDEKLWVKKFPAISVVGRYGDIEHKCKLQVECESGWDDREVDIGVVADCRLQHKTARKTSSFVLCGEYSVAMGNSLNPCEVVLLTSPCLKGRWDRRSDPPHVRGTVRMGKLAMIPGSGMDSKAAISVVKMPGVKPLIEDRFKIEASEATGDFVHHTRKRLKKGAEYKMTLAVDLAPFFGALSCSDITALPK